jgi:hypothetical protein
LLATSCDLFVTRSPEYPDENSQNIQPATSPSVLFSNFNQSIIDVNSESFSACFNPYTDDYKFFPDANILAQYGVVFNDWNAANETEVVLSIANSIETNTKPELIWNNSNYEFITTDSAVMVGDYLIKIKINLKDELYSGFSRFTFIKAQDGLWYIKTWIDYKTKQDSLQPWSLLKAKYSS